MLARAMVKAAFGIILFVMGASVASAASLGVSPVRVTLSESQSMGSLTVRNDGTEPASLQMEMLNWSQARGPGCFNAHSRAAGQSAHFYRASGWFAVGPGRTSASAGWAARAYLSHCPPGIAAPPQSRFYGYTNVDAHQPSSVCFTQGRR